MSSFSELQDAAERVIFYHKLLAEDLAPATRFCLETRNLSTETRVLLSLAMFDGYELFPASDPVAQRR